MMKIVARYTLAIILGASIILYVVRALWLTTMPYSERELPFSDAPQQINIPERPGVKGILISGPRIDPMFFCIDVRKPGLVELDWDYLMAIDPNADIKINGRIDSKGRLHFNQEDIQMEGHTEAGLMIQKALQSWMFTPVKEGEIQFWFNLPSRGNKLIIDVRQMKRKKNIPDYIPVYLGQLHYIRNINSGMIQINGTG